MVRKSLAKDKEQDKVLDKEQVKEMRFLEMIVGSLAMSMEILTTSTVKYTQE